MAPTRSLAFSLRKTEVMWFLTVCSETKSSSAISLLESPCATQSSTASSRVESGIGSSLPPVSLGSRNSARQRRGERLGADVLLQKGHRPGPHRLDDAIVIDVNRENHDPGAGLLAAQDAGDAQPGDPRQLDIEQDQSRARFLRRADRLMSVARLRDDLIATGRL